MKRNSLLLLALLFFPCRAYGADTIYRLHVKDYIIQPVTGEYIEKGIERAEKEKAQAVLIVLDTPGGLLETTHDIVKTILNAPVPVIVYVAPAGARAASAGVFITMAAHVAAMAPATHIGAAHPVQMGQNDGGEEGFFKKMKEKMGEKERKGKEAPEKPAVEKSSSEKSPMADKILQDTLAWVENIAKARDRNAAWAKKSVSESVSITAEEAQKLGVVDFVAATEADVLSKMDGRAIILPSGTVTLHTKGATVVPIELNWRQSILNVLINPNIAYILMILGFYGLLFEITHSGVWVPGVAGFICILLAFYSFHIIPPDYAGIALTLLGLLLFGAELMVVSHGLLGLFGLICLFLGGVFLIDAPAEFLKVSLQVVIPTILASLLIFSGLATLVVRSQRRRVASGAEALLAETGEADTDVDPSGKVFIQGELWDAVSDEPIKKGERVQVLGVENLKLRVKKQGAMV